MIYTIPKEVRPYLPGAEVLTDRPREVVDLCAAYAGDDMNPDYIRNVLFDRSKKGLFFYDSDRELVGYVFYTYNTCNLVKHDHMEIHLVCAKLGCEYTRMGILVLVCILLTSWSRGYKVTYLRPLICKDCVHSSREKEFPCWYENLGFRQTDTLCVQDGLVSCELKIESRAQILSMLTKCGDVSKHCIEMFCGKANVSRTAGSRRVREKQSFNAKKTKRHPPPPPPSPVLFAPTKKVPQSVLAEAAKKLKKESYQVTTKDLTVRQMRKLLVGYPELYQRRRSELITLLTL